MFVRLALFFGLLCLCPVSTHAAEPEPIKIGEMMPYTNGTQFAVPFREGYLLAVEEINKSGGIQGRPLQVISRDDQADPSVAVRVAEELVSRDQVIMLIGAGFDHVGLAAANFANRNQIPFLKQWAGNCPAVTNPQNRYWFSTTPCYTAYASLFAREAAKLPYTRWATIGPNYEFGHVMTTEFKKALKALRPDVIFVAEQYPAVGKINAAAEIQALDHAQPQAIFSTIFGPDLGSYLLYARKIDFLKNIFTISGTNIGSGVSIRALGEAYPKGWLTEGLPLDLTGHPAKVFADAFQQKYGHFPDLMAVYGYNLMEVTAEALRQAKSLKGEDIREALQAVKINGPFGPVVMKNKQLYLGDWIGYTDNQNGHGSFVGAHWYPAEVLFPDMLDKAGP